MRECIECGKKLQGNQVKFCSIKCKEKHYYHNIPHENKKCNSAFRQLIRSTKRKLYFVELKGGKCEICGYNKNLSALEFHHINSDEKSFNLDGRMLANSNIEKLEEELDKCMLICSNCHKELHNENHNMEIIKKLIENNDIIREPKEVKYCKDCGKILLSENSSGYCNVCLPKYTRKTIRPSMEELKELLKNNSLNKIGKIYGVTHGSVKKWAIHYGLMWKNK